jgi:solute carrier family 13 (sodium-dependent dicarboxylate transporter), member 2/3/5
MAPVHYPSPEEKTYAKKHFFSLLDRIPPKRLSILTIIIPFLFLFGIALAPLDLETNIKYALAILVCVSMLWSFGMVPLAVTALLVPVLLTAFGIFTPTEALAPFADPVVFLLVGGLIIAETFRRNNMDKRLSYFLVTAARGDIKRTLIALMLAAALMSMWISNTATVALLIPVALGVASHAGERRLKVAALFLIGIAMATAFGSLSTIVGSPTNAITSALLSKQISWTFVDWLVIGLPIAICCLAVVYLLLPLAMRVPKGNLDTEEVKEQFQALGPMKRMEKIVLVIFAVTIVLWVLGSEIASASGLPGGLANAGIIALLSAVAMFLVGAVKWDDAKNIAWDVMLIIGAGLALGEALEATGAAELLAQGLASFAGGYSILVTMMVFACLSFILTTFLSNTATAALLVPVAISTSAALDIDPKFLALTVGMVASISLVTPVGTPPVTLAYSTNTFTRKELAKAGLFVGLPAMVLITLMVWAFVSLGIV